MESVQRLSTEMTSIREETQELRALVNPPISSQQQVQVPFVLPQAAHVTLPELRAMTDLAKTVEKRVDQLNVLPSDDSDSETHEGDPLQHSPSAPPPSRPGKLKSGREAKPTSEVL